MLFCYFGVPFDYFLILFVTRDHKIETSQFGNEKIQDKPSLLCLLKLNLTTILVDFQTIELIDQKDIVRKKRFVCEIERKNLQKFVQIALHQILFYFPQQMHHYPSYTLQRNALDLLVSILIDLLKTKRRSDLATSSAYPLSLTLEFG